MSLTIPCAPSGTQRKAVTSIDAFGFSGIRIHTGNVIDDTDGCILVGRKRCGTRIAESRIAFRKLMVTLEHATANGDPLDIDITNP